MACKTNRKLNQIITMIPSILYATDIRQTLILCKFIGIAFQIFFANSGTETDEVA